MVKESRRVQQLETPNKEYKCTTSQRTTAPFVVEPRKTQPTKEIGLRTVPTSEIIPAFKTFSNSVH